MRLMSRFFKAEEEMLKIYMTETVIVSWNVDTAV